MSLSNILAKDLKDQCIEMNIKKCENKNTTNEYRYLLKSNFVGVNRLFVLVYSNLDDNAERYKARRYYLPKGVIKNFIINGKNLYDQPVDTDIKRYKEIRTLFILFVLYFILLIIVPSKAYSASYPRCYGEYCCQQQNCS